jgi:ABC-type transport system involved in multi-copper enzyme maturation permease subunit
VSLPPPSVHLHYGNGAQWGHVWRITQLEFKRLCWNPLVMVILSLSLVVLIVLISTSLQDGTGAKILPITGLLTQLTALLVKLLAPLLIIFLAGDLVWRDRDVKIDPLSDPLPVRSWVLVLGKLLALALILGLVMVLLMVGGLISQTVQQYTQYELGVYAIELFTLVFVDLLLIAVLAITIQVLVNQKFLGYVLSAFLIIVFSQSASLFKPFRLLQYGYRPEHYYSQINGYGGMLRQVRWFQGYWLAIALLLLCVTTLFWVRGIDTQPKTRWRIARQRFTRPMQMVMGLSAIAALCLGGLIYYNTHLSNPAPSRAQMEAQVVAYEKAYGNLIDAQPKITAVELQGDLYPEEDGRFALKGTYTLENRTQQPINKILLNLPQGVQVNQLTINGTPAKTTVPHPVVQGFEFALTTPLQPGNRLDVTFDLLRLPPAGFTGEKPAEINNQYAENGLSFRSAEVLPMVGFFDRPRIKDKQRRAAAGLPPLDPAVEANRQLRRSATASAPDADRVQFSATLSTAADQIAITAGEPVKQWTEGDRHYFQYQSQVPIEQVVPILSGRYEVLRDQWQDVQLEMYYHPGHDRNLERMVRGTQKTLDYASQNFSPFPHKTLRTVEVPYQTLAMSFPTTIIRGERFGYLAKFDDNDPTSVDEAFRIAAHETAHQWWGQQLIPSATPGARFLLEALPEYTANQVYAQEYGLEKLGAALRRNLDSYLQNRDKSDLPLVEAEESHLVYQKGSLALFALQDYIGEDVVNGALASLLKQFAEVPPYPTATDLVTALRAVTPEKYQYLITDLFETVTLYDNRVAAATITQRPDGQFDVTLTVNAAKLRSDNVGNETPTAMNQEEIDVGVYDAAGKLIYLKKHPFSDGQTQLTIAVDQPPASAGIDPLHKLIDKTPDDNRTATTTVTP